MVLISNTSCCKRFQQVTTCTHTICTQTFLVGHFPWVLFDHSYSNFHLALLFQGIQFIFLDLTTIRPLHCSSHFFPQIPPQKFSALFCYWHPITSPSQTFFFDCIQTIFFASELCSSLLTMPQFCSLGSHPLLEFF